ncbi:hypothetical protein DM02DRAFT_516181, partial [Periconia macrospinosa]
IATLPYYRFYRFNTAEPLTRIAELATRSPESIELYRSIGFWRERKLAELQFVSIACTVLAAAVIGAFSWDTIHTAHWLTHGFWHSSLIFSILGILLSATQIAALHALGPLPMTKRHRVIEPSRMRAAIARYSTLLMSTTTSRSVPRKKMMFTWQGPTMLMSYSVCSFIAGLTILVCSPLIRREGWGPGYNIAIMYLTVLAVAGPIFMFCSFWAYHHVKTDIQFADYEMEDADEGSLSYLKPVRETGNIWPGA